MPACTMTRASSTTVAAPPRHLHGVEGVWAAGDCRRGPATVVEAIADAAEVARAIAGVDFNKYADCNEQAGREDTCYERKGSLCRDKRNCTKTRCLGCGSVCEVCCDVCPNRANVAIKVPGLAKHQVVHVDGMCNECGNCAVFCPYQEGRPTRTKLTLFWSEQDMENSERGLPGRGRGSLCCSRRRHGPHRLGRCRQHRPSGPSA